MLKVHRFFPITSCVVLALLAWTGGFSADPAPAGYRIEDLGTFGGPEACEEGVFPTWSGADGLNELGHAVGWAESSEHVIDPDTGELLYYPDTGDAVCDTTFGAALWRNGEIIDIVPVPGGSTPWAHAVNDHDAVVGHVFVTGEPFNLPQAFLWTESDGMINLLEGTNLSGVSSNSWGINNFGEITIMAGPDAYFRDVNGELRQILFPDKPDWGSEEVYEINDDGITVGGARRTSADDFFHAFTYDSKSDSIEDLNDPFYIQSLGYGINEQGDAAVVMTAYTWHGFGAVVKNDGELVVLPLGNMRVDGELRPDLLIGGADDINAHGDVVGNDVSVAHRGSEPWIAFDVFGDGPIEKIHLEELLSPEDRAEWDLASAWAINDERQIAGWGAHDGKARAFLLTPDDTVLDGDAGIQVTTEAVSGVEPSRVEIETAARLEAVVRVVPESLGPNRAVGMLRPRPSIEPRESDGLRNLEPASEPDDGTARISHPAPVPRSIPRDGTPDDDLEPFDRNSEPKTRDDR